MQDRRKQDRRKQERREVGKEGCMTGGGGGGSGPLVLGAILSVSDNYECNRMQKCILLCLKNKDFKYFHL